MNAPPMPMRSRVRRAHSTASTSALLEVEVVARRRRAPLTLVLRSRRLTAVRVLGRGRHPQERDLPDLHPRVERDREVRDVRELEGEMAVPAGVDEARGAVDQQPEATERALA